jgi:WD40 repeat protein
LVIGDIEGVLHQWSFPSKAEVKTMRTERGAIAGVAFAPDGKVLVTTHQTPGTWSKGRWVAPASSASGSWVMIWNTDTWTAVTRQGFGSAAFSKDGKMLALGGDRIELIDPRSQRQIRTIELPRATIGEMNGFTPKQPIPMSVVALAFSPDGGILAAGCQDGTVRLVKMNPVD